MMRAHGVKIDANLVLVLDALLQTSSVTKAARQMGLSQSAMSHALGRLRDVLGDPLLVRTGRRMERTPKAVALMPHVQEAVSAIERIFRADVPFEPAELTRTFRIHIPEAALVAIGPALFAAMSTRAPLAHVHTCTMARDHVTEALRDGALDVAVDVFPELPHDLDAHALFTDRLVCVVRREHPVIRAGLTIERFADLPHVRILSPGPGEGPARDGVDELLAAQGVSRRVVGSVSCAWLACVVVACTDSIATLPERLGVAMAERLGVHVLELPLAIPPDTLTLAWHKRATTDPAHRWLRDQIVRVAPPPVAR